MKSGIRIIGLLSVVLLICVLVGQGIWLTKMKEVRNNGYHEMVTFILSKTIDEYLGAEFVIPTYDFACSLSSDGKTFTWDGQTKTTKIPSFQKFDAMMRLVFYDHLYQNHFQYLEKIDSIYRKKLLEVGIQEQPVLMVWDSTGQTLMTTDSLCSFEGIIFSKPLDVGYECKHQMIAAFPEPPIFRSMSWHLIIEVVFLSGFIICLCWQWQAMKMTWQNAKVQTLGMAHLEHELKKPLAVLISAMGGIVGRKNRELTETQEWKLKLVRARLLKMADVTDTMMMALKTSGLKIERRAVDICGEVELMAEMFAVLYPHAKVEFFVEEGIGNPLLDSVYFNYLMINLIDNGIKYGGDHPEVKVWFGRDGKNWLLTVKDHGIGMPSGDLKRIFRQFYRVKDKRVAARTGFGLGLTFVKKVVDAYGGEIRVESKPGQGSRFEIRVKRKYE